MLMWGNCNICFHFLLFPFLFPPPPAGKKADVHLRGGEQGGTSPASIIRRADTDPSFLKGGLRVCFGRGALQGPGAARGPSDDDGRRKTVQQDVFAIQSAKAAPMS